MICLEDFTGDDVDGYPKGSLVCLNNHMMCCATCFPNFVIQGNGKCPLCQTEYVIDYKKIDDMTVVMKYFFPGSSSTSIAKVYTTYCGKKHKDFLLEYVDGQPQDKVIEAYETYACVKLAMPNTERKMNACDWFHYHMGTYITQRANKTTRRRISFN